MKHFSSKKLSERETKEERKEETVFEKCFYNFVLVQWKAYKISKGKKC